MSEFVSFMQLGLRHILNLEAMDHLLFLLALAAIYRPRDWRDSLWVVSAFTIGHSITLALAVTGLLRAPSAVVEFLIPVTIVATGIENIVVRERRSANRTRVRPILAGVFGLVHGAGFATYLESLFMDHVAIPLFGFNVGIELAQIVVLVVAGAGLAAVDGTLRRLTTPSAALRLRIVGVSLMVTVVAARWAVMRSPW